MSAVAVEKLPVRAVAENPPFVHLRVHSEYSVSDGLCRVDELVDRAAKLGMPALALTDFGNLFAMVKFYDRCRSRGIKPLLGAELTYRDQTARTPTEFRCLVLAADERGYRNLLTLVSLSYVDGPRRGCLERDWLLSHAEGLVYLSGGTTGEIGDALLRGDVAAAARSGKELAAAFGDRFYLEVMRTGRAEEERLVVEAVALAAEHDWPVVATNDVCFLVRDDFEAHETRVCIQDGRTLNDPRRPRRYSAEQYLKNGAEMARLFADLPEALENSVELAKRLNVTLTLGKYFLPQFPAAEGESLDHMLRDAARRGLEARFATANERGVAFPPERIAEYRRRLETEVTTICKMAFAGYFLIVAEFIAWAKREGIPVGPGRGSGAGSLVAYALGITGIDPISNDLLFERFMNPERVSMPDFDIDFCMEGRDRVIAHVADTYGHDAVGQIITFGTMAAKAVVRDVARVQGKPYGLADRIAKLIPFEVGITLEKAVDEVAELKQLIHDNEEVAEIMEMAFKLEGIVRNVGRHAGGVVIAPGRLSGFVPLYTDDIGGGLVSQFDKDDVERAGLVKFDFLGLKTLTIIDWAVDAVNRERATSGEAPIDIEAIESGDTATFDLLKRAETTAVFQLESRGMKDLIRRLQPDCFEDIVALVALFRPGPLQSGMVDDFIQRKHGQAKVEYPHPSLEPVLSNTYGVILYQEQVMQIAQVLAGFSLGQADLLRRAMGKKKPEEMAALRDRFSAGAVDKGVDRDTATHIFDLMEKFAGYGFNKSHSAAYAIVSYQTAWLKTHHPAHYMAAVLSADMHMTDKVVAIVDEVRRMGIPLDPPNVNASEYRFTTRDARILYGLGAIKGVGEGAVESIVAARKEGPFKDLDDFCLRVDPKKANRRFIEALIRAGAMDTFAPEESADAVRARLLAALPDAMQGAEQVTRNLESGMTDLFGGPMVVTAADTNGRRVTPLSRRERLEGEKEALGLYLTGHPIDDYLDEIRRFCPTRIADVRPGRSTIAGLVVSTRTMRTRRGDAAFTVLDDRSDRIEVSVFSEVLEHAKAKIGKDAVLIVEGTVQTDEFTQSHKMIAERISTMDEARVRYADRLEIRLCERSTPADLIGRLRRSLEPHRTNGCPVAVTVERGDAVGRVLLGEGWRVAPSDELLGKLRNEFGSEQVRVVYRGS